ncbi:MAG: hypothetical protein JO249_22285 [Acidobacteria bacterium]|nr:hypothetical protein [Acidobacteriota bacterium]
MLLKAVSDVLDRQLLVRTGHGCCGNQASGLWAHYAHNCEVAICTAEVEGVTI